MSKHQPHPANVPGDFYVEDDCCTGCEMPFTEAPDLFGWWPIDSAPEHCFVKRQPQAWAEIDEMISAIRCAELGCIHYRGNDRAIQSRLVEVGEGLACDDLPSDLRGQAERMETERRRYWESGERTPSVQGVAHSAWWHRLGRWWHGRA